MAGQWCPDCRAFMADGTTCPECRRRRAWGTINRTIHALVGGTTLLTTLEAVAFLMQDRQALIDRHRREMNDEARAAQRGARDAYDQGHDDGRIEGASER